MNTDIRLSVGFWEHPKTIKLERRLGLTGVRSLQILWLWATQNRPDGVLSRMDAEDIEIAAKWDGEPTALYRVLTELGFVDTISASDGSEHVVNSLHGWAEHNSWQAESETRSGENRLKRLARSYPDVHKALLEAGCKTLTGEEYRLIQALYHGGTTVSAIVVQISTARSTPFLTSPCLSSPSPTLPEERETSLRSVSSSGSVNPDMKSEVHPEVVQGVKTEKIKAKQKPDPLPEGSEAYRLAVFMHDELAKVLPTFKEPDLQAWALEFDVALRNDKRMKDARFVAQVIRWVACDSFWRTNCQSPGKLRKQFDQLTSRMAEEASKARASPGGYVSTAQRRLETNKEAGRKAKELLFGPMEEHHAATGF